MVHKLADLDKVRMYESRDGPGPNLKSPKFDLRNNSKSLWNGLTIDSLLKEVQDQCLKEDWPVQQPDPYIRAILMEWYKWLQTVWQKGQPKITDNDTADTPIETEVWLIAERELVLKEWCQATHHWSASTIFSNCYCLNFLIICH